MTPPTRLVKAADGNLFPEIGSESFFMRDGGLPWVAGRPHKAVWFFAGADDVRDLSITARLQQASDPALLLVQERLM